MSDTLMTIREMCDAFAVTPRTLRFYEQKELLAPVRQGTKRLYSRRERARLTLILRGKRFGFSLEEIRQLLNLYDAHDDKRVQLAAVVDMAKERLADMVRQRDELTEAIGDLSARIDWGEARLATSSPAERGTAAA